MTRGLTERQERILGFIVDYVEDKGYPPSIREIGNGFGISSLRGVTVHLDALERKGYIKRASTSRSITVIGRTGPTAMRRSAAFLPLVGTIAAGTPITATENVEQMVPVPPEMVRSTEGAFVLRVKGDSMINEHIMPRDLVVIKPQSVADNGDLVAVLLGDEATVKRIHFHNGSVRLVAANPAYNPIEVTREDGRVIGKVIGLMRDYGHGSY
ncbi:MAG TPA: transcriptional repressor LexA [Chthonomonadales bacterium]|nr:transcriptional repressor LexA [Chthonomonadales bacterium]